MVRFLEIFLKEFLMNLSLLAVIAVGIGILAIISVLVLIPYEKSDVEKIDLFTPDKETQPVETPEIQEKLDKIESTANDNEYKALNRDWQTSGAFQIDRSEYAIGESIFIRIGGLELNEKGQIAVMRPLNATHYTVHFTIPFDEAKKSSTNTYFTPQILKSKGICSVDDLIGKWALVFRGTNYPNLNFNITERVVPGTNIESVC